LVIQSFVLTSVGTNLPTGGKQPPSWCTLLLLVQSMMHYHV